MCSFLVWKNACLNYREFDLEGDPVGVPHTWYLSAQSFIRLLKLVWRESDLWLWMSRKRNVSVCRGHELANTLYAPFYALSSGINAATFPCPNSAFYSSTFGVKTYHLPSKDEVEKLLKWSFVFTTVPMEQGRVRSPWRFLYTALASVFFLKDFLVKRSLSLESCVAGMGFRSVHPFPL